MNVLTSSLIVCISDIDGFAYRNELIGLVVGSTYPDDTDIIPVFTHKI